MECLKYFFFKVFKEPDFDSLSTLAVLLNFYN